MGRPKSKATRNREASWDEIMFAYRYRHRRWVMEHMPQMSDADWKEYETWVAGFGAMRFGQASRNSRKVRRGLRAAKQTVTVAATGLTVLARGAGAVNRGSATRQK